MAYDFSRCKTEIKKAEEWLIKEYSGIHAGRATPAVLDPITVEVYGSRQPISHAATIGIEDPRTLRITPWDKDLVKVIEKAIIVSNLGLSVVADAGGLRVSFPQLTTERKTMVVKLAREKLEEAKIGIKRAREETVNDIQAKEKAKEISEDERFRLREELQKMVDAANEKLIEMANRKEKEILA